MHRNELLCRIGNDTYLLKTGSIYKVLTIFINLNFDKMNIIFFLISNYEENSDNDQQFQYKLKRVPLELPNLKQMSWKILTF